ncbi:hypothetical protein CEXT_66361 [Caerostris extrusa]|uniref:Uncharacterized protein n=1 Tax=Caerostris extrusa TaxID=172846 RepID=A0AAV4WHF6_CAEEX|nr:hypothetical protein CEXT_66361 [Caerostris extrusa]
MRLTDLCILHSTESFGNRKPAIIGWTMLTDYTLLEGRVRERKKGVEPVAVGFFRRNSTLRKCGFFKFNYAKHSTDGALFQWPSCASRISRYSAMMSARGGSSTGSGHSDAGGGGGWGGSARKSDEVLRKARLSFS